jgi:hypothetical protein
MDLWGFWSEEDGTPLKARIYGPSMTKGLARWAYDPASWIKANADSLAMYAMAKYMQKVTGKYLHLPLATELEDVSPSSSDGTGDTGPLTSPTFFDKDQSDDCTVASDSDGPQEPGWSNVVFFKSNAQSAARSMFPDQYLAQYDGWWADAHPRENHIRLVVMQTIAGPEWMAFQETTTEPIEDFCKATILTMQPVKGDKDNVEFPTEIPSFDGSGITGCVYSGTPQAVGTLTCEGAENIYCYEDPDWKESFTCDGGKYTPGIKCHW